MTEKDLLSLLAERIRNRRKRLGLTIEHLAENSGVDAGFLGHIETKVKSPSLATLAKIVDGLKVAPNELFQKGAKETDARKEPIDRRLYALVRSLTAKQKTDLVAILAKLRSPEQIRGLRMILRV